MSLLKLWFIRNPVLVSYRICMRQGSSDLSESQIAMACLCVCARAQLGLREFNTRPVACLKMTSAEWTQPICRLLSEITICHNGTMPTQLSTQSPEKKWNTQLSPKIPISNRFGLEVLATNADTYSKEFETSQELTHVSFSK
jgi:hypothetical protein